MEKGKFPYQQYGSSLHVRYKGMTIRARMPCHRGMRIVVRNWRTQPQALERRRIERGVRLRIARAAPAIRSHRDVMAGTTSTPGRQRSSQLLSTILFVAAIGFAAAALWVWYTDDSTSGPGAPPRAETIGGIDLAQVLVVLEEQDDGWDYSRNPATASTDQFSTPGQVLQHGDDELLLVFIFTGADDEEKIAARERASEQVDLESAVFTSPSGNVVNEDGGPLYKAEHGNVMTILIGGTEERNAEIQTALDNLP